MDFSLPYGREREILLVDDDIHQIRLFQQLLRELGYGFPCIGVTSGPEALAFLRRQGEYREAHRPHLIVLDVNMPGMNGCEVLAEIKADPALRPIPVVMFSLDPKQSTVQHAYDEHANAWIRKPEGYDESLQAIRTIAEFWFKTASLPETHLR